jgi:hypothetical protein
MTAQIVFLLIFIGLPAGVLLLFPDRFSFVGFRNSRHRALPWIITSGNPNLAVINDYNGRWKLTSSFSNNLRQYFNPNGV